MRSRIIKLVLLVLALQLLSACSTPPKIISEKIPVFGPGRHYVVLQGPIEPDRTVASQFHYIVVVDEEGNEVWEFAGDEAGTTTQALFISKAGDIIANSVPAAILGYFNNRAADKYANATKYAADLALKAAEERVPDNYHTEYNLSADIGDVEIGQEQLQLQDQAAHGYGGVGLGGSSSSTSIAGANAQTSTVVDVNQSQGQGTNKGGVITF